MPDCWLEDERRLEDKKFNRFDCIGPDGIIATILVSAKDRDDADAVLKEVGKNLQEHLETA